MHSQSAIEFLTTYGFLFLIIAIVFSVLFFLAKAPSSAIQASCTAYAGPVCNIVQLYSNATSGYSVLTIAIANSQPVPINITGFSVTIHSGALSGACTPSFLWPGQWATCSAEGSGAYSSTSPTDGFYQIPALFCNSGISGVSQSNCTYEKVTYSGAFVARSTGADEIVFSVAALQGPGSQQGLPFGAIINNPHLPANYTMVQNGDWVSNVTGKSMAYSFATSGVAGQQFLGHTSVAFPSTLSDLSSSNVACSFPFNSMLSVASTTLYVSASATSSVTLSTDDEMQLFYKVAQPGNVWQNVSFGSNPWKGQGATQYGPSNVLLSPGLYNIEVWWSNVCGGGEQTLAVSNLPAG